MSRPGKPAAPRRPRLRELRDSAWSYALTAARWSGRNDQAAEWSSGHVDALLYAIDGRFDHRRAEELIGCAGLVVAIETMNPGRSIGRFLEEALWTARHEVRS